MVIMRLDTVIADPAVVAPRRPPDMTRLAVLDGHLHGRAGGEVGFDNQPRRRGRRQRQRVLRRWRGREAVQVPRQDARVRDGGVDEGGEADECHVGEDDGDGGRDPVPEPACFEDEEENRGDDD